jgi:uncharacterized protein YlzI (FlbEa/FlbD family)
VIAVKKLDGSTMHLNGDLIERVESCADGQSALYMVNGGHIIAAHDPETLVEKIRTEKANLLRRVLEGPGAPDVVAVAGLPRLSQVRGQ